MWWSSTQYKKENEKLHVSCIQVSLFATSYSIFQLRASRLISVIIRMITSYFSYRARHVIKVTYIKHIIKTYTSRIVKRCALPGASGTTGGHRNMWAHCVAIREVCLIIVFYDWVFFKWSSLYERKKTFCRADDETMFRNS